MKICKVCNQEKEKFVENNYMGIICEECDKSLNITGVNSEIHITNVTDPTIKDSEIIFKENDTTDIKD